MSESTPVTVICSYEVRPGKEAELEALLSRHWPALRELGLVTDRRPQIFKGLPSAEPGEPHGAAQRYVEIFEWKDEGAPQLAHESPSVMAIWEPMDACCESMDFPHFASLTLVDA